MAHHPPALVEHEPTRLDFRKLRTRRRMLDLTQQELAEAIGVTRNVVMFWELGVRVPRHDQLLRASRALGVPIWDLYDEVDASGNPVKAARR